MGSLAIPLLALAGFAVEGAESDPREASDREIVSQLVEHVRTSVDKAGLTIDRMRVLPVVEPAKTPLHMSRLEIEASGPQEKMRGWLQGLHDLDKFRAISSLRIMPHRLDPGRRSCRVLLNRWFVPTMPATEADEASGQWRRIVKSLSGRLSSVAVWGEIEKCIPEDSGLLLASTEMTEELEVIRPRPDQIRILGMGETLPNIKRFGENLQKIKGMDGFLWQIVPPQRAKDGKWSFMVTAIHDHQRK